MQQLVRDLDNRVQAHWLPSHNKRLQEWRPPVEDLGGADEWRGLNSAADTEAGEGSALQERRYKFGDYDNAIERADWWARFAFDRMYSAAAAYINGDAALKEKLSFTLEPSRQRQ